MLFSFKTPVPRQVARVPNFYTRRPEDESTLRSALLGKGDEAPLTLLYGMPGVGKTTLAACVVDGLEEDAFPGGIGWGDLDGNTPKLP